MARQIQTIKRQVPLEQIIAVQGRNPYAAPVTNLGEVLGEALLRKEKLRREGQQLAKLESLAGQNAGAYQGLDLSTGATLAQGAIKQKYDTQDESRKLAQNIAKVRALESQFNYKLGELGDDHPSALLRVQNDLINKRQQEGSAAENRKQKEEQFKEKQGNIYSSTLEKTGIPNAVGSAKRILNILPEQGQNIPGYGPLDQYRPNFLTGAQGKQLRQAVSQLFNIELKDRSGAAVTTPELERLKLEFGQGNFSTEDQLRDGIQQYLQRVQEIARNVNAGFAPDVVQEYQNRGGLNIPSAFDEMLKNEKILPRLEKPKPMEIIPTVVDGYQIRVKK